MPTGPHPKGSLQQNRFYWSDLALRTIRLAAARISPDERARLLDGLAGWPADEQRACVDLSIAAPGPEPFLELIGHGDALPLARVLRTGPTVSPAPDLGAYDIAEIRTAHAALRTLTFDELCVLLGASADTVAARMAGAAAPEPRELDAEVVRAVLGQRRDELGARVRHSSHSALPAYGALPLAAGESVEDRLRVLWQQLAGIAGQRFRAERWRSHLTGTRCAVVHLAQVAGVGTVSGAIAAGGGGFVVRRAADVVGREWVDGPYRATVEPAAAPGFYDVALWRGRRRLLDAPKAFRGSAALAEARMAQASITRWL